MSGSYIPLSQFATQLAAAGAGSDISGWTATIASGGTPRSFASAFADAPYIEWFGPCGNGGDDTGVFTKAIQSGIPFRLGPKTYIINGSWSSGQIPFVIFSGYAGVSRLLRMAGGASGAWIGLEATLVDVRGVVFDANRSQVQANTWNVLIDTSVSSATLQSCAFRNNAGALGRGLAIIGSGSVGNATTYNIGDCEFSGNSSDGCAVFQASGVTITQCRAFANGGSGINVGVTGTPSSTNINQGLLVKGNRLFDNTVDGINIGTINPSGSSPPIYTLALPSLSGGAILDNLVWANGSYGIQAYGDYLDISGNQIDQQAQAAGGIVMTARHSRVSRNVLNVTGAYIGVDTGGCIDCSVSGNIVYGAQVGINPGGCQSVTVDGNRVVDCMTGMSVYDVETDGNGIAFPAAVSVLAIEGNTVLVADTGVGISILDGGAGIAVVGNRFVSNGNIASPNQALMLRSGGVLLHDNTWNGVNRTSLNTNAANLLVVADVFDSVELPESGALIDSVAPYSVIAFSGQVSFINVTTSGTGYTHAVVTITGAGSGAAATVMLSDGMVVGFRVTADGTGYVQSSTSCVIVGDGAGATAVVVVGTPIQPDRQLRIVAPGGATIKQTGTVTSQVNSTQNDLVLAENAVVGLVEVGGNWLVSGLAN